ncbi:hypothetical protein N7931_14895 [Catenovulum sp. 2E275]|uniref:hypothetical protein n=1 Tax=Catenovulum sp. 2E275 TaxID=2980497 RepID=UPI0021CF4CE9|nr:hypothetical protein [Catenovulum sp. 2E275]MCU4676919.1 hypothetical protein [Catenovulum sp. 2E275]
MELTQLKPFSFFILFICIAMPVFSTPNSELVALVAQDQSERENGEFTYYNDLERLKRVKEIIAAGGLQEGIDYYNAALIFQHGKAPEDFLTASQLASKAVELNYPKAKWLSCAAEDRYLLRTGKPQIWGTQYNAINTYELMPLDESLKTDKERMERCNLKPLAEIKAKITSP